MGNKGNKVEDHFAEIYQATQRFPQAAWNEKPDFVGKNGIGYQAKADNGGFVRFPELGKDGSLDKYVNENAADRFLVEITENPFRYMDLSREEFRKFAENEEFVKEGFSSDGKPVYRLKIGKNKIVKLLLQGFKVEGR